MLPNNLPNLLLTYFFFQKTTKNFIKRKNENDLINLCELGKEKMQTECSRLHLSLCIIQNESGAVLHGSSDTGNRNIKIL